METGTYTKDEAVLIIESLNVLEAQFAGLKRKFCDAINGRTPFELMLPEDKHSIQEALMHNINEHIVMRKLKCNEDRELELTQQVTRLNMIYRKTMKL